MKSPTAKNDSRSTHKKSKSRKKHKKQIIQADQADFHSEPIPGTPFLGEADNKFRTATWLSSSRPRPSLWGRLVHNKHTALHCYAAAGRAGLVRKQIDAGADVNSKSKYGTTALHEVCQFSTNPQDYRTTLHMLVQEGGDVDARDDDGRTPLHDAVDSGQLSLVQILLDKGADPNLPESSTGLTPVFGAVTHALKNHGETQMLDQLLANGADINYYDKYGGTPLHHALSEPLFCNNLSFSDAMVHTVVWLLTIGGADPNAEDNEGYTALIYTLQMAVEHPTLAHRLLHSLFRHGMKPIEEYDNDQQNNIYSLLRNANNSSNNLKPTVLDFLDDDIVMLATIGPDQELSTSTTDSSEDDETSQEEDETMLSTEPVLNLVDLSESGDLSSLNQATSSKPEEAPLADVPAAEAASNQVDSITSDKADFMKSNEDELNQVKSLKHKTDIL